MFESFESVGDWTVAGAGGSLQADTTNVQVGSASLRINFGSTAVSATKTISTTAFAKMRSISFWLYINDVSKLEPSLVTTLFISSSTTFATSYSWRILPSRFRTGWNKVVIPKSEFTVTGAESWSNTMVRIRFRAQAAAGQTTWVSVDDFRIDEYRKPQLMLNFDSSLASQYTEAYSYMDAKSLRGSAVYQIGNVGQAGYMTDEQIGTLYDEGWDILPTNSADATTASSQEEVDNDFDIAQAAIVARGYDRGDADKHFVYNAGGANSYTGSAFVTYGLLTGRTLRTDTHGMSAVPVDNSMRVKVAQILNTTTYAAAKAYVDNAVGNGQAVNLVFNSLVTTPSSSAHWAIADFQALVSYIKTLQDTGFLTVRTATEFWKGLTNPRYRSIPLVRSIATNRVPATDRTVVS